MNDKIVIREPLFVAPNEQDNFFSRERKEGANLINHISTNGPYKRCERLEQDGGNEQQNDPPQLNEREDMSCFVKYKGDIHNLSHEKNVFNSCRKGEINAKYNIMENIHDVHYTNKSTKNLNDFLKHVKINHTAPCVGEFRTCMNCFVSISTLFCKTCNIFLCAVCSIKLHKNEQDHIINVASSGLFQNDYSYNDVIVKEKDKWLVEMDNNIPVKIREKCSVHTSEYVKYACKTCQYILLCTDCLLNDPVHVQNEADGGRNTTTEKRQDGSNGGDKGEENNDSGNATLPFGVSSLGGKKSEGQMIDMTLRGNSSSGGNAPPIQTIVSIDKKGEATTVTTIDQNDLVHLKPGFKLIRGSHEIYTLVDAKNEIKQELNDKLEVLCKKSLVLKNTIPSLRNIYKYGKITSKNVKRSIRASFTITNTFLEKKKKKLHQELKMVQDRSTQFLAKMDEQRINYHSYLERKKNELQHMVKLSGRNAGLSLDYYVEKLESYKCLFFSKDNLIDIEKKLEIPHSKMKSEHLPSLVETMKVDVLEAKKSVSDSSALIRKEFEKLFNCSSEISVYPAHFKDILQKRIYDRHRVEPVDGEAKRRQRYFHVLPFTDLYMNMEVTYQQQFWRKDSLHQKWEVRTVSLRSIYLCVHTHADEVVKNHVGSNCVGVCTDDSPKSKSGSTQNEHFISKNEINNFSNDIESVVNIANVSIKLFSDPDITNITILEKRNHPYGIEITEYNEKKDLCGYWLLTCKKESDVNTLFNTLVSLKKENKGSTLIPSFHPKINMSNPMFHFHHKNVNSVYKHLAANLVEQPVVLSVGEDPHMGEIEENRLGGKQDSLETVQSGDTANYNYDRFMRDSSLLYYYDGMDDPDYLQNVKKYQIEDLVPGQINLSDSNDQMALAECSQNMCAESSSAESMNPFSLRRSALGESQLGGGQPQTNVPREKVSAQEGVGTARLRPLVGVHPKRKNINPPDVNINTVKPNLVQEEQHFMCLNVGSNFSHGDYTPRMYSQGVQIMKGVNVGIHTGCYSNGDAQGGSFLTGGIPVSGPRDDEGRNVGEQTNEHLVERRNGDHIAHVSDVTREGNYGDKLGLKNGLILSNLHVEEGMDACSGTRKGEPHAEEEPKRGDTKVSDLEETFAKTGELLNNEEVTKFLRRLDWAENMSGGLHEVGPESATRAHSYCKTKRLTDERQSPTIETEANNTPGRLNEQDHRTRNGDSKGEPNGERFSKVYSDGGPSCDGTPMNGTALFPHDSENNTMQVDSRVRRENLVGASPPCGEKEGDALITVEDNSSVRASAEVMNPFRKMNNSEREGFPVGEMNAKVPFKCGSNPNENPQKGRKIDTVLSDQREDLDENEGTTPGGAIISGDGNEKVRPNGVHTDEQIQKGTHSQTRNKNCVMRSPMEDLPREEDNRTEISPTRMDNRAATSNLKAILKPTPLHANGGARIVQGRMRSGVGRFLLQKEESNKIPPPKKKKNKDSAGTSAVSTSKSITRLKTLHDELTPAGDVPESVISRVMSQIGSKRLGS
ncbi:Uncharacterized protein PCOAH_00020120 [Plasmodium coatneyi]|uniref:B box-type domain-containing protein n=1 Tax=Plasmodium coatneyi TaxID=208452 RepID=A0A1B1DYE1_9APIC|nr:Uncharacterized protein PCOAH_00020120 [Plasmodium coatneyi]ANQ07803.1 Uncharacterized protein PCOAH_00020120 [Plasmodium coatneyi]